MGQTKLMPTTFLVVAILAAAGLHVLVPLARAVSYPWNLGGVLPLALGVWLNLAADRAFKRAHTTVRPFEESAALVQDGVFRLSRNPMYLGFEAILLGIALLLGSASPWLVVVVFPFVIERVYVHVEERMLEAKFGDEWRRYKARVRKWL
jgi:protein-S-isoprenylcysteine O-methyltransferase Ste14